MTRDPRSLLPLTPTQRLLVADNILLAQKLANTTYYRARHLLDLQTCTDHALDGLIRAAQTFDPARGIRFSTYATNGIRFALKRVWQELYDSRGNPRRRPWLLTDLDLPEDDDTGTDLWSQLLARDDPDQGERLDLTEEVARVKRALRRLPLRERLVLRLRFLRGLALRETAGRIGVSFERVRQLQAQALERVRQKLGVTP